MLGFKVLLLISLCDESSLVLKKNLANMFNSQPWPDIGLMLVKRLSFLYEIPAHFSLYGCVCVRQVSVRQCSWEAESQGRRDTERERERERRKAGGVLLSRVSLF